MMEWLRQVYARHQKVVRYLFFGGCTTAASLGSYFLFTGGFGIHPLIANMLSWILAVGFAYLTNRRWVFVSAARDREVWQEAASFYGARLLTLGLEELLLWVLMDWLEIPSGMGKLLAQSAVLVSNYLLSKWIVFHR